MCVGTNNVCICCKKSNYHVKNFHTCKEHILDRERTNKLCKGIWTTNVSYICSDCKRHSSKCSESQSADTRKSASKSADKNFTSKVEAKPSDNDYESFLKEWD